MQASEDLPFCALEESFPSCTCLPQNIVSFSVNLDGLPEKLKGCLGSLGTLCIHIPFVLLVCIGMYFVLLVLACSCFVLTVGSKKVQNQKSFPFFPLAMLYERPTRQDMMGILKSNLNYSKTIPSALLVDLGTLQVSLYCLKLKYLMNFRFKNIQIGFILLHFSYKEH